MLLDPLVTEMTDAETVIDGATIFINGVPQLVANAVTAAIANGATADQLKPVTDLGDALKVKADALQAAILANTPQATP